jgi:anthranilate phosphoribosyltransferase
VSYTAYLKVIGRGPHDSRSLSEDDANRLMSAMLDGGVPDMELGGLLMALSMKGETLDELLGFYQALDKRVYKLPLPTSGLRPVVIPTYNGARRQPNLTPLIALWLKQFGVPVLLHGEFEGHGRVATVQVLRELDILPCASLAQAEARLENERIAFVPTSALSPGLASLLNARSRLGVRNSAHTLVKLIDPFDGMGLRLISASHSDYLQLIADFLIATGFDALLLHGTEGEPYADPKRRPALRFFQGGEARVLFEAESGPIKNSPLIPDTCDAATTARWIKRVLARELSAPLPLVNQLACCLYASGYSQDFNQAKAIAAVETGSLAAA